MNAAATALIVLRGAARGDLRLSLDYTQSTPNLIGPLPTLTRASVGRYFDSSGVSTQAAIDAARIDYVYNGSAWVNRGLLLEPAATNTIRNSTSAGGSAGVVPTNWTATTVAGITRTIVGVGTENGIAYVDIRLNGTATGAQTIQFESTTQVVGATAQDWNLSTFLKLTAGSLSNLELKLRIDERTAAGGLVATRLGTALVINGTISRYDYGVTTSGGGTVARIHPSIQWTCSGTIDATIRIGLPQLENLLFPSSPIPTSSVAVTRSADLASIVTGFASIWNASAGTIVIEGMTPASGTQPIVAFDDNTANESIIIQSVGSSAKLTVTDGGVTQADITAGTVTANTLFKLAASWSLDDFAASFNGAAVVTDSAGTLPTVDRLRLGASQAASGNCRISRVQLYASRKPNAFLQSVTA